MLDICTMMNHVCLGHRLYYPPGWIWICISILVSSPPTSVLLDVCSIDRLGYIQLTDRSKDVVKSGGEWISTIEIENLAMGHPEVAEAAVIAIPNTK